MRELSKREQLESKVRKAVTTYLSENFHTTRVPMHIMTHEESREHAISIGTSIMLNRIGIDTRPGSFVKAVLDNDLSSAVLRADNINSQMLAFYTTMMYNMDPQVSRGEIEDLV